MIFRYSGARRENLEKINVKISSHCPFERVSSPFLLVVIASLENDIVGHNCGSSKMTKSNTVKISPCTTVVKFVFHTDLYSAEIEC
jgi:hypothetical protein